jgi:hypothetical protein
LKKVVAPREWESFERDWRAWVMTLNVVGGDDATTGKKLSTSTPHDVRKGARQPLRGFAP